MAKREFYVVIENDGNGGYIGEVPQLKSCHSHGETLDELMCNMKEVILLCLDNLLDYDDSEYPAEIVGIQKIEIELKV
jgi:predicted RNase H-like HicB family nuclease